MKRVMRWLDPNKELPRTSVVWYLLALALMAVAVYVCYSADWQSDGFYKVVYEGGKITKVVEETPANSFSIAPQLTSIVWAVLIYGALLVRKYVRNVANIPVLLLVLLDVVFIASLIESFLPAQSVCLFKFFKVEVLTVNPQMILVFALLVAWLGMRAISGFAIILLLIAFLSRSQELNVSLGMYGTAYALCGIFSLVIQCKLPSMVPEIGLWNSLKQDFGRGVSYIGNEARQNILAVGDAVASGVKMSTTAAVACATGGASLMPHKPDEKLPVS